jgi:hypothetical protein
MCKRLASEIATVPQCDPEVHMQASRIVLMTMSSLVAAASACRSRSHHAPDAQHSSWSLTIPSDEAANASVKVESLATTSTDAVVVGGTFNGTLRVGHLAAASTQGSSGFIAKLTPDGRPVWLVRAEGDSLPKRGLAIDRKGDVYVSASGVNEGKTFNLSKYRSDDGSVVWRVHESQCLPTIAAASTNDTVFIAGRMTSVQGQKTLSNLGDTPTPLVRAAAAAVDLCLASYAFDGTKRWTRFMKSRVLGRPEVSGLAVLADGSVVVTGVFDQGIEIGDRVLNHSPSLQSTGREAFVASFDKDGQARWSTTLHGNLRRDLPPIPTPIGRDVAVVHSAESSASGESGSPERDFEIVILDERGMVRGAFPLDLDSRTASYSDIATFGPAMLAVFATEGRPRMLFVSKDGRASSKVDWNGGPPSLPGRLAAGSGGTVFGATAVPLDTASTRYRSEISRTTLVGPRSR